MRIGYAIGDSNLITALNYAKNSFNSYPLDRISQIAAIASVNDENYFQNKRNEVINIRKNLVLNLQKLNFTIIPSAANFIFAKHNNDNKFSGEFLQNELRKYNIIVRRFNSVYDEVLVEPDVLLPDNEACLRLPGTDGKNKMSKSLGNCIYLADTEADVKKKVMSMYTDPTHIQISDPGHVEGNTVFTYLDAFSKPEHFEEYLPEYANLDELKAHYTRGGLGDVKIKKFLNNVIQEELAPIRARRAEYEKDIPAVYEILKKGSQVARETAAQTLSEVKRAMQINYFDDEELIKAQAQKYSGQE